MRMLGESYDQLREMYGILFDKCAAVERLLAEHHGAETVNEDQVKACPTCGPLLMVKDTKEVA